MRVNQSFTKKLVMPASFQLGREVAEFSQFAAWAGIKGSPKQARKARGNHYGEFETENGVTYSVPKRQFIWAATHNQRHGKYAEEIKRLIMKGIHDNPTPHKQEWEYKWNGQIWDVAYKEKTGQHGTPVFAGRDGYEGLLQKIAKQMETNQYNAISEVNIIGKKHNAESTQKRKGKDHPLEDTLEMLNALKSGVMKQ